MLSDREVTIADKYDLERGRIFLTGVQACVRVALDQRRADARRRLRTAMLVSGYPGSPLAGLDSELGRAGNIATEHSIFHVPGLNEELAATAVWGAQLAQTLPQPRYAGVLGMWYGKSPGLDRAGDAMRHGNWVGTSPTGGVLALVGDDPSSKSSTQPSASEAALADLGIPILYPGSVQEVLDLGLHAFGLSRASGLWAALKMVTDVADGVGTADIGPERIVPVAIDADGHGPHRPHGHLLAPQTLDLERSLVEVRLPRAAAYARANELNRTTAGDSDAWLGLVAAGKTFGDLMQALEELGLDEAGLRRVGVRILKLGMIFPLEPEAIRAFARGLDEIVVLEEKRPFLESQVKEVLYGSGAPAVSGKRDPTGQPLLPSSGELEISQIAEAVVRRLAVKVDVGALQPGLDRLRGRQDALEGQLTVSRTPFFCSGCPHNRSTGAPEQSAVGVGIGCHTMVLLNPDGKGRLSGVTQMGGEGAQWVGMAPFSGVNHFIQNLGDGTFHHSGSLGVRFAVAAGVNVTFKLLYNGAVAMTGGQAVEGALEVPELTRMLEAEGISRTIITAEKGRRYRGLARNAEVWDRDRIAEAQDALAKTPGVTVLIHDQECAAELRRLRKRGKAPEPDVKVVINERVCEGCGDCGQKSSCLSVQPVGTEFGRKTQVHQPSCNKDMLCLEGDCPSFLTVTNVSATSAPDVRWPDVQLPDPEFRVPAADARIRFAGIGGTGVVTVNQIVGMAAMLDGRHVCGVDQTGLSQKGGPVISDLRISAEPVTGSNKAPVASLDAYLALDLLTAVAPKNLAGTHPEHTVAVISTSAVPTGQMVVNPGLAFPAPDPLIGRIAQATRGRDMLYLDAERLSLELFADHMQANMVMLGAAFQHGAIPVSAPALEAAVRLNGASVDRNLAAFAWGRACVVAPDQGLATTNGHASRPATRSPSRREQNLIAETGASGELERLLQVRLPELADYQSERYAADYARFMAEVRSEEQRRIPGSTQITEAVARGLFKLMAYKDEYEVARLHLLDSERSRIVEQFGPGARVSFNLHPPILRSLGLKRKLRLGPWFTPALRVLRSLRRVRGTWLDPFGHTEVRRIERTLPGEYRAAVQEALSLLDGDTSAQVLELASLPEIVNGYEEIKLRSVARYREELDRCRRGIAETGMSRVTRGEPDAARAPASP